MPTQRERADRLAIVLARARRRRWPVMPLGKRGEVLLLLGIAWILIGIGAAIVPPPAEDLLFLHIPVPIRAALWCGTGLVAIGYAWMPRVRSDGWGFVALYLMPAVRAVSYFIAWVDFTADGRSGYRYGWLSALFYTVFIGIVVVCAGWREPPPLLLIEEPTKVPEVEPPPLLSEEPTEEGDEE